MSQEKVIKTLESLGLTQMDAKVYVLIAKKGPIKARDAAKALKISKQRLYPILKNLQSKGIVNSTLERPARFTALPFEKVLDLFVKVKLEQAQRIQQNRDALLSDWQSIAVAEGGSSPAKFTVIKGRRYVYSKIQQMIQETKSNLSFVATVPSLARADQYGLFDAVLSHPLKSKIRFRFLTELSEQNAHAVKAFLKDKPRAGLNLEGKTPDLGLKLCPRMVIRDEEETLFFIDAKNGEQATERDDVCLWTNCNSLVRAFSTMFEELWRNATEIEKKIEEIETNKPSPKTYVISDAQAAKKQYEETLSNAEKEIVVMTSSTGLLEFWRNKHLVTDCTNKGVSVRIMAPITGENLGAAQNLRKFCEVKHVALSYLGTAVIDGQHLFQFKNPPLTPLNTENRSYSEKIFYSNDSEYVNRTKNMLEDIWEKAHIPSAVTMDSIMQQITSADVHPKVSAISEFKKNGKYLKIVSDPEASKKLTEKEVLHRALSEKRISATDPFQEFSRMFCTWAWAVIHPPKWFNLPKTMISALHIEKQSSLGEEDTVQISLWLNTPIGYTYVPVGMIHDSPRTYQVWKKNFAGTPTEHNIQTVNKDEIQVRVRGNKVFAGWTAPIPLWPKPYSLPPCCILFDGYGDTKPGKCTMTVPNSGVTNKMEFNKIEAFVTLLHQESKYEGPGTEGFILRDCIIDTIPNKLPQADDKKLQDFKEE